MRTFKKKEASPRKMMLRIGVATIVGVISIALSIHYMKLGRECKLNCVKLQ